MTPFPACRGNNALWAKETEIMSHFVVTEYFTLRHLGYRPAQAWAMAVSYEKYLCSLGAIG